MSELPFINIDQATAADCIDYAAKYIGKRIPANAKEETAREKLAEMILEEEGAEWKEVFAAHLPPVQSNPPDSDPEQPPAPKASNARPMGKRVKIKVMEEKGDKRPIFVAVNFKGYSIQRGKEVEVPEAVVDVLRNATRTIYDSETMESQEVPAYPFQIVG